MKAGRRTAAAATEPAKTADWILGDEAQPALYEAARLSALAGWIEKARHVTEIMTKRLNSGVIKHQPVQPDVGVQNQALHHFYFAVGITNSAPLAMLSGQRCMMLFCLV